MQFQTKISKTKQGVHSIRGHDLVELIEEHSFCEVMFLLLRGDLPEKREKTLLEAMLVACVENGIEAPSLYAPRVSVASGNPFHVALAAGMLAIGEKHGGAGEKAAEIFSFKRSAKEIVDEFEQKKKFIPGFGHKIYKEEDPRAASLYKKAKELGFPCSAFTLAYEIEKEVSARKGKKIPLNIDGALAACMVELGFDAKLGKAFFLISRIVGMSAHVLEELEQKNSYYRLEEQDIA